MSFRCVPPKVASRCPRGGTPAGRPGQVLRSWGVPVLPIHDAVAVLVVLRPELFELAPVCIDVETQGELTSGQTVPREGVL